MTDSSDAGGRTLLQRARRLLLPIAGAAALGVAAVSLVGAATSGGGSHHHVWSALPSFESSQDDDRTSGKHGKGRHGKGWHGIKAGGAVADTIGISTDELREAIANGDTIAEIAEANGVDPQTVVDELVSAVSERLDQAVEQGKLTADEAAEKLADAEERIVERVNTNRLQELAELIGADAPGLREALKSGSTLAAIAESNGIDPDSVVEALLAKYEEKLDAQVAVGDLTQEEADAKLVLAESRIEDKVNEGRSGKRGWGGKRHFRR